MSITSAPFLFLFLPISLAGYYIIPNKKSNNLRNLFLLAISLFFYAWGEPIKIALMLALILITWLLGRMVKGQRKKPRGKWGVALMVIAAVGTLFICKYLDFVLENIGYVINKELPSLNLVLPLGISFFSFSTISYVVDVYRGKAPEQKNILNLALYLSFFVKITSGPVMQYNQFAAQLENRKISFDKFAEGIWRIIAGLGKKVLLAGNIAYVSDAVFGADYSALPVANAWIGTFAYLLQIFFDFSGYSDIAIGLGKLYGFDMTENFNFPYIATSVTEYWQRWHKSLGEWFRDYLYYPFTLGPAIKIRKNMAKKGYSKDQAKLVVNIATLGLIWSLTGLWHGAQWNYLIWGLINGSFSLMELYRKPLKNPKAEKLLGWWYTISLSYFTKAFIKAKSLSAAGQFFASMFHFNDNIFADKTTGFLLEQYWVFLLIGTICCFPIFKIAKEKAENSGKPAIVCASKIISAVGMVIILIIALVYVIHGGSTTFIYQNF